jgi:hypothetical protein
VRLASEVWAVYSREDLAERSGGVRFGGDWHGMARTGGDGKDLAWQGDNFVVW